MTIDEQIKILESNSEFERKEGDLQGCLNFKQLAEWLKDYKRLKEQEPIDCTNAEHDADGCLGYSTDRGGYSYCQTCLECPKASINNWDKEQEPCGDCISREAALDLIADYDLSMGQVVKGIHALPSVTPQPKMGHWIKDKCSICGEERAWYGQNPPYCPDCGSYNGGDAE
jgi:hypothetical protein